MTENSAIFNARHGAGSFHPHRQPAPTAQPCLKRGDGANWRTTRQLSGECQNRARDLDRRPRCLILAKLSTAICAYSQNLAKSPR
jgi:hypothetical protein